LRASPPGFRPGRQSGRPVTTDDPVELERQRLARDLEAQTLGERLTRDVLLPSPRWSLAAKIALALAAALVVSYLLVWVRAVQDVGGPEGYIRGTSDRGPVDFVSTLTGGYIISQGGGTQLYDLPTQQIAQNFILDPLPPGKLLPYNHLPWEALLVAPLMDMPFPIVFAFWTMLAGLAIGISLGMMDSALPVTRQVGWVMSMAACSYLPLIRSLMLGQNSPMVLMGLCGTYVAIKRNKPGWAGAALLLVALKPQVLPLVLLLVLAQGHWRAIGSFVVGFGALSILSMPVLGLDWPIRYASLLLGVANWQDAAAIDPGIMHNWRGFFTNLFDGGGAVGIMLILATLLSVMLLLWTWLRSRRASGEDTDSPSFDPTRWDLLWALTVVVAVLISPHLNPHDLSLLIFPAWIAGAYAMSTVWYRWVSVGVLAVLWAGYLLAPLAMYAEDPGIFVIPSVLLMSVGAVLLGWQATVGRWRVSTVRLVDGP
jgi:hypothetical protein